MTFTGFCRGFVAVLLMLFFHFCGCGAFLFFDLPLSCIRFGHPSVFLEQHLLVVAPALQGVPRHDGGRHFLEGSESLGAGINQFWMLHQKSIVELVLLVGPPSSLLADVLLRVLRGPSRLLCIGLSSFAHTSQQSDNIFEL